MTSDSYGNMRANDADREAVRAQLADAHAEGRLTWEEFDARVSAVLTSQTYGQLAELTSDLPARFPPTQAVQHYPGLPASQRTNGLAIASMVCGFAQVFIWGFGALAAVILGHLAMRQIRQTGEQGSAMAVIGLALGYLGLAFTLLVVVGLVAAAATGPGLVSP